MKIYEKIVVPVLKETLVRTVCDICKKDISANGCHYEVTTGHNDWGNDSIDSVEHKDICSNECLQKEFDLYLKSLYTTKYIEIEKEE